MPRFQSQDHPTLSIREAARGIFMTLFASAAIIGTLIVLAAIAGPSEARSGGGGTGTGGGGTGQNDGYVFPLPAKHVYEGGFGDGRGHDGQDLFARCGAKLVATQDAKVQLAGNESGYGNMLVLDIKGTKRDHVYAHMRKKAEVREGENVVAGQKVGEVGDSGNASGCHLHFELHSAPGHWEGGKALKSVTRYLREWDKSS